jgi:hypothetical protein
MGGEEKIVKIDDIEDVKILANNEIVLKEVAVSHLDNYKSYLRCRGRVEPADESSGRCSKADCRMLEDGILH